MPRTYGQAIGFLLGFALVLWLSPFGADAMGDSDLERLEAGLLDQVNAGLQVDAPPDELARLRAGRDRVLRQLEHARTVDTDLESIRGSPRFDALFDALGDAPLVFER